MPGNGSQHRRRQPRRLDGSQHGNRRIYDPRRWHRKSSTYSNKNAGNSGQPPAGWMLVWAGRFKRWRRRWFVAHPPGLLLHYKNGDQIGRPGCISLLGATASPTPGKERQMKIVRGSMVYYLRTLNKDFRQPWLDAIHESMLIYKKSVQKAAVGAVPGRSLLPQQSVPEHVKEEWEAQERELNRRLAERMHDLEPSSQEFLQQLQSLQQSLSIISGALGFTEKVGTRSSSSSEVPPRLASKDRSLSGSEQCDGSSILRSTASSSGDEDQQRLPPPTIGDSKEIVEEVESHTCPARELAETAVRSAKEEISTLQKHAKSGESTPAMNGNVEPHVGMKVGESEKQVLSPPKAATTALSCPEKPGPVMNGPIHAAWHRMHEAFAEALKGEIHRTLELEAENAMLQESLAMLPQLKKDHKDLISLNERLQNSGSADSNGKSKSSGSRDGDEEEGHDSEDEIAIVHSERGDEEYFEALEVLNRHDFISKSTNLEDSDGYSDREDDAHEPPEEGDVPVDAELLSEAEGDEVEQPRTRLPAPRPLSRGFSLWTVLKNAIGKDLNHITMPATINEPLSVLQKCAEEMQYRHILERAAEEKTSIRRLLHVSAFACASYHGSIYRDAKPFNPLLGETYEWLAPDEKSWFLTEQVSHHPPIMAFQSESIVGDYKIYGEMEIRNKFWGKSVEVLPTGVCHLRYNQYGDHFTWHKVTTCAHNVVVGKLWIDNYGELVIKNHTTGEISRIRFHKAGSKDQCRISGKIYDPNGVPQFSIYGNYQEKILGIRDYGDREGSGSGEEVLWERLPEIEDFRQQYCFSKFSIGLNELTTKLADTLPPTDSRFRPDQRALEDGDLDKATPEKLRLEDKQRFARKQRKERGQEWKCLWFERRVPGVSQVQTGDDGEEPSWVYQGKYWEMREKQTWQQCPDIM